MNVMISGFKVSKFMDTSATNNFVRKRTAMILHNKTESGESKFKVVNSIMKLVGGVAHVVSMNVGN